MKILLAPDKFKHSLSSFEVCAAIEEGLLKISKDFKFISLPLADGGDGLSEIISHYISPKKYYAQVADPLFRTISSSYLLSSEGKTAFIEMAKASGLQLLQHSEFNAMITSTYGTGELIKETIQKGAKNILLGIGGSATNDCGIGMAAALGYRFLDKDDNVLHPTGENLIKISSIDTSSVLNFAGMKIEVACDVTNPLTGEYGATRIYGPQKGADPETVEKLEKGMIHFARLLKDQLGKDINDIQGAGAAGGLGAGCIAFLNAELISGIELIFEYSKAEKHVIDADLVITGEGKIDEQSLNGKVLSGLAMLCKKHKKPLIAVCGTSELSRERLEQYGIMAVYPTLNRPMPLSEAYKNAYKMLSETSENIGKDLLKG